MELKEAKRLLLKGTEDNNRLERSCANDFVRVGDFEHRDSVFRAALEELLRERAIEQLPSAGQSRTTISYKRAAEFTA